jgi:hypothetical protein
MNALDMGWKLLFIGGAAMAIIACGNRHAPARMPFVPLAEVEAGYGRLITVGNHPTPDQHGTGERLGLFQGANQTVWGLPLTVESGGVINACAPPMLRDEKVTDTFPAGWTIIGTTNEPTGWRGGTGDLELLLRDAHGTIHWQVARGAAIVTGPVCSAPELPGPPQELHYYRLAPSVDGNH